MPLPIILGEASNPDANRRVFARYAASLRMVAVIAVGIWASRGDCDDGKKPAAVIPFVSVPMKSPIEFDKHVYPILAAKCASCHDSEGGLAESKFDLTTVSNIAKGGKRGPGMQVGNGAKSLIVLLSAHQQKPIMPPKAKDSLTAIELSTLKRWIDEGAKPGTNLEPAKSDETPATPGALPADTKISLCVDFSPDGKLIAFGQGGAVVIRSPQSAKPSAGLTGFDDIVQSVRFSPDGKLLAVGGNRQTALFAMSPKPSGGWQKIGDLACGSGRVLALDFSSDGKLLVAGGGMAAMPGELSIWEVATKRKLTSIADSHSDTILAVAFSSDGKRIATAGADKFVRVFEAPSGKRLKQLEGHQDHVLAVAWLLGDKVLISGSADGSLRTWTYETGEPLKTFAGSAKAVTGLRRLANRDQVVTTSADRQARTVNAADGRVIRSFGDTSDYLHAVAVSKDAKFLAACGQSGKLFLWNLETGAPITAR